MKNWDLLSPEMLKKKRQHESDFRLALMLGLLFLIAMLTLWYLVNKGI